MKNNKLIYAVLIVLLIASIALAKHNNYGIFEEDKKYDDSRNALESSLVDNSSDATFSENEEESYLDENSFRKYIDSAFEEVKCPVIERNLGEGYYNGKLIDTHMHMPAIPDDANYKIRDDEQHPILGINVKIGDYICMMNYEGTDKVFAFFPVWEPIISESVYIINKTLERYPGRFVPFIMPPDSDGEVDGYPTVDSEELKSMLAIYPDMFKGYGEIGLYERGDHGGPKGAPALPPDSERLNEIYPVIRENKLLVYFHLGEGQKESFEKILKENRDINFIWHGDQLISYGQNNKQDLSKIDQILTNNPNAYYGVDELYGDEWLLKPEYSKEYFMSHFRDYKPLIEEDLRTWKDFIEKHQDQVLWGTDRGGIVRWSLDNDVGLTLNNYSRYFIGHLKPEVQEKFAYKNAEKLIV